MKVLIVALVAAASIAVLAAIPSPASADTQVVVPSTGPWTDTGVDVSAGQQLEMINTAGWSEGNEPVSDADGSPKAWPDNFLNLTDLGVGPYEAQTLTPHWEALIGYIGDAPPQRGSYAGPQAEKIRSEAEKVFYVGSVYKSTAPRTGRLWLTFNADAYSNHTVDNRGEAEANIVTGPTPTPSPSPTMAPQPPSGATYVALGDSYSSGEGLAPYYGGINAWCHRSPKGYPALLGAIRELGTPDFQACTGAKTSDLAGQLQTAGLGPNTRFVTLTIGGDDLGFADVLEACVRGLGSNGQWGCRTKPPIAAEASVPDLRARINALGPVLRDTYLAIHDRASRARLNVGGYPRLFGDHPPANALMVKPDQRQHGPVCRVGVAGPLNYTIDLADLRTLNRLAMQLNGVIADAVTAANQAVRARGGNDFATFVSVSGRRPGSFESHGLCDTSTPWIGSVLISGFQPDPSSFHPTAVGQCHYEIGFRAAMLGNTTEACSASASSGIPSTVGLYRDYVGIPFYSLQTGPGAATLRSRHSYRRRIRVHRGINVVRFRVGHGFRPGRHRLTITVRSRSKRRVLGRTITVRTLRKR